MAKENTVILYGRVISCNIKKDEDGNYLSGKIVMHTIRRTFATSEFLFGGDNHWDTPCVYSRNPEISEKMAEIEVGDLVYVKGTLCTQDSQRKFVCSNCGGITKVPMAVMVYIDPIFTKVIEKGLDENDAYQKLREESEISNQVYIDGTLCREPSESDFYTNPDTGKDKFQFQIASNRIRRIKEDDPDKRVDYPWVKCYGDNAKVYYNALHIGSSIFIDGAIQTRKIVLKAVCEHCRNTIQKESVATEIVPYHLEFLDKCEQPFGGIDISEYDEERDGMSN